VTKKAKEYHDKADYFRRRAAAVDPNRAIFSDDPDASEKLIDKLERLKKRQGLASQLIRKADREGLADLGFANDAIDHRPFWVPKTGPSPDIHLAKGILVSSGFRAGEKKAGQRVGAASTSIPAGTAQAGTRRTGPSPGGMAWVAVRQAEKQWRRLAQSSALRVSQVLWCPTAKRIRASFLTC
jgi:hypothetical protein